MLFLTVMCYGTFAQCGTLKIDVDLLDGENANLCQEILGSTLLVGGKTHVPKPPAEGIGAIRDIQSSKMPMRIEIEMHIYIYIYMGMSSTPLLRNCHIKPKETHWL